MAEYVGDDIESVVAKLLQVDMCKDKSEFFGNSLEIVNNCLHFKQLFEYERNLFVCQDFGFCQDFVSMKDRGRRTNFKSLEVREAGSSHLKIAFMYCKFVSKFHHFLV